MSYIDSRTIDSRIQNHTQEIEMLLSEMKQNLENYKRASDSIIMTANTNGLGNLKSIETTGDISTDTEYDILFREQQQRYARKMDEVNSLLDTISADSQSIKTIVSQNLNSIPEIPMINPNDEAESSVRREKDFRETVTDAYWNIGMATATFALLGGIYYIRYRR